MNYELRIIRAFFFLSTFIILTSSFLLGQTIFLPPQPPMLYWFSCNDTPTTPEFMRGSADNVASNCLLNEALTGGSGGYLLTRAQRLVGIRCLHAAVTVAQTWTFTARLAGVDTALTCSSPEPALSCSGTASVPATAGQLLTLRHTDSSAQDGGEIRCVIEAIL